MCFNYFVCGIALIAVLVSKLGNLQLSQGESCAAAGCKFRSCCRVLRGRHALEPFLADTTPHGDLGGVAWLWLVSLMSACCERDRG
jgi:hypothetical protein